MPQTTNRARYALTTRGRLAVVQAQLERCWDELPERVQDDILAELAYVTRQYDRSGASRQAPA